MSNYNPDSPTSWHKVTMSQDSNSLTDNILEKDYWQSIKAESKIPLHTRLLHKVMDSVRPIKASANKKPISRTGYLDGLRGFAAFLVYWQHHNSWVRETSGDNEYFENAFGYKGKYHLATFPFLRVFWTGGHFAVPVFFVISGYVLAAKPLSLIQSGESMKLLDNLSSALFRRWMRLWIPVAVTTFIYMTMAHYPGFYTDDYYHKATYREEIWEWYSNIKNFSFMFDTSGNPFFPYNGHIWTIPQEFKGSIAVYVALISFSRFPRNSRLFAELVLIWYFIWVADGCFFAMFIAGMFLCDLDLLAINNDLPRFIKRLEPYRTIVFYHLLVIGLYISGVPAKDMDMNNLWKARGWYYLAYLKPQATFDYKWFYLFWAAAFTAASIPRIGWLRRFFEGRFCQYLGKISFGLYLVHGPVIFILADRLYSAVGFVRERHMMNIPQWPNSFSLSMAGPLGMEFAFLVPHIVLLPITFWLAEIVTKFVDEPAVRFAQNLYRRLANAPGPSPASKPVA
ncbi:related to hard surface induced protein 3 (sterol glycosyl transferase) [Rhynchosporium secalis]|uniref:Related to hard surface induced protein 3 (Sterol glycosyl transferase) n=1 Tax=Rhynchosporium secalis TaxID=38038 RepID=A0A1E1LY55_RHYSE|nr:related to hard surface induced protein 3 (sterol glycosyl transferase) [Rhynchosporium secalis]